MKCFVLFFTVLVFTAVSKDIVVSKDSLWVFNNFNAGKTGDTVKIINNGSQPIYLDSAHLIVNNWDTRNPSFSTSNGQAVITEDIQGNRISQFFLIDSINATKYNLDFSFSSRPLLSMGPSGDSAVILNFEVGGNLFGDIPVYPLYFSGLLQLYFTNGETVSLQLYSDDLRPTSTRFISSVQKHSGVVRNDIQFLINGKKIPDKTTGMKLQRARYRTYGFRKH